MKKITPLKNLFEIKDNYLSVSVSGHFSLFHAKKIYADSLEILLDKNLSKLFFDVCKVNGKVTTMDRYYLGEFAALESIKFLEKGLQFYAVTFYGIEPIIDSERFGELVAKNRGLNLKVTSNKNEALKFLGIK